MIDIHNHCLYGVDDGSDSYQLSLELLKNAEKEGITDVVCTPHFIKGTEAAYTRETLLDRFEQFKSELVNDGVNIQLHLGNELFIHSELDSLLEEGRISPLGNTHYVLVEFPFDKYKSEYDEYLYNIKACGYKVIVAHPERYRYVQEDLEFVDRWIREGYLLQGNQNSLFHDTKKCLFKLIEQGRISFMASDAHSKHRPCTLIEAYKLIQHKFNTEVAELLFETNPKDLLQDKSIEKMPKVKKKLF